MVNMKNISTILTLLLISCSNPTSIAQGEWIINEDYIREGCFAGKDCIPSIDSPHYSNIGGNNLEFLNDNDLVVGIWDGSDYIAYPHPILDWHEVVNETGYSISYCPLTGSAIHFETPNEFGVSGMLYNSNLIMYDRKSDSYWPQMLLESAAGTRQNEPLKLLPLLETTWGSWKKLFPNSKVLNSNTNHSRDYDRYPYGNYKNCNAPDCGDYIYFPIEIDDDRLLAKERVLSIISDNDALAIKINSYNEPEIIHRTFKNNNYVIVVSAKDNIGIVFKTDKFLEIESWDIATGEITLAEQNSTNRWDILGRSVNGAQMTADLSPADSYIAYWFALASIFPNTEIMQ
ncbi:MAG: DUF3179 domain-containing (seleno)protein [Candidatus Neomarinimicrobiota bacterium]